MSDYKMQLLQETEAELAKVLDQEPRAKAIDTFTRSLADYEVIKSSGAVVPYHDVNAALLKRYCACLLIEGKSAKTVQQYKRTAEHLADTLKKNYNEVTVYDIRFFLACEKQRGVSNRTLENQRAYLSAFFQWLFREELAPRNPCINIAPIKYTDKVRLPFSTVEIDKIRAACKTRKERALVEFLLSSGVRASELTALEVSDINFNASTVHVREGKGAKERTVYINDLAKTHLQDYLSTRKETGNHLFYTEKHEPICAGGVRFILKNVGKRAGVENVHPHRFRRTFATGLANRGMNIQDIQRLLGHTSINTTMEYVCVNDSSVHAAYIKYIS